jgi:hypothetical protein
MFRSWTLLLVAALCAPACGDNTNLVTPTNPTITTESFPGTVTVNGAVTHQFAATGRGTVTATLTAVGPDRTTAIGVSLGTWNGSSCQVILANDQMTQGASILGQVTGVGNLCLRVYDQGKLTTAVTYSVDVSHP